MTRVRLYVNIVGLSRRLNGLQKNNPDVKVVKLDKPKVVKEDLFQLVGECLF
jgi:hypothetical protein